jgi:phosphatidylserine/phosphatidylglycerophosphate/cardiolipin synthase-like enzyme/uncharacterized membrane protein YdjX (TVP38/TMEM64 family)
VSILEFIRRRRETASVETPHDDFFEVGRNCSAIARADRVSLIVDGEAYFRAFALAAERAQSSIVIVGWDFHSMTQLHFDAGDLPPARLGEFLNWLVHRRRHLHIYVLDWDYPLVFGIDRETRPLYGFGWRPRQRVHLAYDNTHPVGASHHQKIVVIDDALAFVGGLDLTARRWDTILHDAREPRRLCGDEPYPPFHDLMMAVDGQAARELSKIARERWREATGRALPRVPRAARLASPWPSALPVDLRDATLALARTMPATSQRPAVREVEQLFLDMIAVARKHIYIENQYFTAHRVGDALAASLAAPDGPEIVVLVRLFSHGWLEEHTMHVLRSRLVQRLRTADRHGRFFVYYPHRDGLAEATCIDLHSKVMIVDDEFLRIGSANLANRSMGFDSECDAALRANGDARIANAIRAFRNRLLAEHLGADEDAVEASARRHGSLHGAIDEFCSGPRRLCALESPTEWPEEVVDLARIGDPKGPVSLDELIDEFSPERFVTDDPAMLPGAIEPRRRWPRMAAIAIAIVTLAALWRYTPLAEWIAPARITEWAQEFAGRGWAPLVILAAYTPACLVMFPRPLITLAAVVAFGPRLGFVYALTGILLAALLSYLAGLRIPRATVRKLAGQRLLRLADRVRRRGLFAMTALRLVPVAPFVVVGVVAAAIGVRLSHYLIGTLLGMLPGTLATTIFGSELETALHDVSKVDYGVLALVATALVVLSLAVRRWLVIQHRQHRLSGDGDPDHRPR